MTSVAMNLLSGNVSVGLRVMLAGFTVVGVLFATDLIRRLDRTGTSTLRRVAPDVLLAVAAPLILMSALGEWGGYVMFIVAALVAIAVSSEQAVPREQKVRIALVRLGGMALIAAGPASILAGLRGLEDDGLLRAYLVFGGFAEIAVGTALLSIRRMHLPVQFTRFVDQEVAIRLVVGGGVGLIFGVGGLGAVFRSPSVATAVLPAIGLAVALTGCGLVVLLTSDRVGRIKDGWRAVVRARGPDDPAPSFGQLVQRFIEWLGERSGMGPPPWSRPPRVPPDADSPPPS